MQRSRLGARGSCIQSLASMCLHRIALQETLQHKLEKLKDLSLQLLRETERDL